MPIKKTKIRTETSRILAETIIGPKKQPLPTPKGDRGAGDGGAPGNPAQS